MLPGYIQRTRREVHSSGTMIDVQKTINRTNKTKAFRVGYTTVGAVTFNFGVDGGYEGIRN
jgi:hypothetical protein